MAIVFGCDCTKTDLFGLGQGHGLGSDKVVLQLAHVNTLGVGLGWRRRNLRGVKRSHVRSNMRCVASTIAKCNTTNDHNQTHSSSHTDGYAVEVTFRNKSAAWENGIHLHE